MTIVQQLAQHAHSVGFDQLPPAVVTECKRMVLDSIGVSLAGLDFQKGRAGRDFARVLGAGGSDATIIGDSVRVSVPGAAFANAELINTLDWDMITNPPGHIAPAVIASAMAAAEVQGCSGRSFIEALAIGYDLGNRFGRATDNLRDTRDGKPHIPRVFGYTGPIFGAAAAVARIRHHPVEMIANGIGIAACISPVNSMMSWIEHAPATTIKYTHMGSLAMQAVTAAYMAEFGHRGDIQVLDDREHGYPAFIGTVKWEPQHLLHQLGTEWRFPAESAYKPYPHCRVPHGLIDGLLAILDAHDIQPAEIEGINVYLEGIAAERAVWTNAIIDDPHDAQFSLAHGIAVAAHRVPPGKAWLAPELIHSRSVMELMTKVRSAPHPDFVKLLDQQATSRPARVEVMARGRTFMEERRYPKGAVTPDPATFMSDAEIIAKFRLNAQDVLPQDRVDALVESVMSLETVENFASVMRLTGK